LIEKPSIEYVIVVEIKTDNDNSEENKAKYRYVKQHFTDLNSELQKQSITRIYIFHCLSPSDHPEFFNYLRNSRLIQDTESFKGELEILLEG
jgi:type III restriction enzyme